VADTVVDTRSRIVEAARRRLLVDGFVGLSTRKVAEEAEVPLSQLHYHFGSKGGLVLALFEEENKRRLDRQTRMYAEDTPLWRRYEQACDFLEDDLESGYVRVLQEMIAAGWSSEQVGDAVRELLGGWFSLLAEVARDAERRHGPSARSPPTRWLPSSPRPSSGPRHCSCLASTASSCRSARPCGASGSSSGPSRRAPAPRGGGLSAPEHRPAPRCCWIGEVLVSCDPTRLPPGLCAVGTALALPKFQRATMHGACRALTR
jgi:AcrR family transcriptional regulator